MNDMQSPQTVQVPQASILPADTVLVHTSHCVVREQEEQHLIYNTKTDEMYLIPKTGTYLYELCDGLATIEEIVNAFAQVLNNNGSALRAQLKGFLEKLVDRGILKAEHDV